jgi:hypothetical protein
LALLALAASLREQNGADDDEQNGVAEIDDDKDQAILFVNHVFRCVYGS